MDGVSQYPARFGSVPNNAPSRLISGRISSALAQKLNYVVGFKCASRLLLIYIVSLKVTQMMHLIVFIMRSVWSVSLYDVTHRLVQEIS